MIIDIENKKGYVFDTDKPIKDLSELFVAYFSEKRASELGLSDAEIKKGKTDTRKFVVWYTDGKIKNLFEEIY